MSNTTNELRVIESDISPEKLLERYSVNAVYVLLNVMENSRDPKLMFQAAQYVLDRVIGRPRPAEDKPEQISREELIPRMEAALASLKKTT